jgi:acyl-CoA synthetase (AMP-forming)/AMP-acid ligase II
MPQVQTNGINIEYDCCGSPGDPAMLLISSIELENAVAQLEKDTIRDHLSGKVAKWWVPENIEFVADLSIGATGKVSKKDLRARLEIFQPNWSKGNHDSLRLVR